MAERFFYVFSLIEKELGAGGLFLLGFFVLTICFVVALLIAIFCKNYTIKKLLFYPMIVLGVFLLQTSFCLIFSYSVGFALLNFAIGIIYFAPLLLLNSNKKIKKKQVELARYIDEQVSKQKQNAYIDNQIEPQDDMDKKFDCESDFLSNDQEDCFGGNKVTPTTVVKLTQSAGRKKDEKLQPEIDFSHVKNVINRLEYFPLSQTEKKQVCQLENLIIQYENQEITKDAKSKINDGLGALLKIMAKHGV